MCIEPPRPRFVPASLRHQLGEHPERVEALREAVAVAAVGRRDHVGRRRAASTRRRPRPPARSTGARSRAPRRRGRARPPAPRTRGSRASAGASRGGRRRVNMKPCIVLVGTNARSERAATGRPMAEQIDIPASFAGGADVTGKRVVITGASRGLGRLLAHAFSQGGARVALVARTETDLKAVAAELPGPSLVLSGDVTDERLQRGGRRRHRRRVGRRRRLDLQRGDLADRGRAARDRSGGVARDPRREPHRRVPRRARRGAGDGRRAGG